MFTYILSFDNYHDAYAWVLYDIMAIEETTLYFIVFFYNPSNTTQYFLGYYENCIWKFSKQDVKTLITGK